MIDDTLSEILNIDPLPVTPSDLPVVVVPAANTSTNSAAEDATYARDHIRGLIESSVPTLQNLIKIANDSQHPRAYEVVTQLVKAISDLNKDLMEIHKKEHELTKPETGSGSGGINVKNAVFVGTTKELHEQLKQGSQ